VKTYRNLGGNSGVIGYDKGIGWIMVYFKNGFEYTYNHESAGSFNISRMKELAIAGRGLNGYIKTNVNDLYVKK
jgi:hypothetical protein